MRNLKRHHLTGAGRALLSALLAVCIAVSPAPALAFSVGEERELGDKLLSIVRRELKIMDDPDITQYINRTGRSLLAIAGPQFFNFHFFVVNNKDFNAFAAPSGLVFVHSGLIETTASEGELVGVIAHEIGHAASRHLADRISKSSKVNLGTAAMVLAGIAMGSGPLAEAMIAGSMAAGATMNLKFSRQDEEEADRLAYKWLIAQERDPADMVGMLKKMRRISRYRRETLPAYLQTHPEPENRLQYIEDLLLNSPPAKPARPLDDFAFQRIRYRIMAITGDPASLLQQLKREPAPTAGSPLQEAMSIYGLAQATFAAGDLQKAQELMAEVIARLPERPILLADLGIMHFTAGQNDKALPILEQAAKADPDCAHAAFYLARALQTAGQNDRALDLFTRLSRDLPFSPQIHYHISQIMGARGDQHRGHYHLGIYYWYSGDAKNARYQLRLALKGLPGYDPLQGQARELLEKIESIERGSPL